MHITIFFTFSIQYMFLTCELVNICLDTQNDFDELVFCIGRINEL